MKEKYGLGEDIERKVLGFGFGLWGEIEGNVIREGRKEGLGGVK